VCLVMGKINPGMFCGTLHLEFSSSIQYLSNNFLLKDK
jgi:hypothetical protein